MTNFRRARDLLVLALCAVCLLLAFASFTAPAILAVDTGPPGLELVRHPAAMLLPATVAPIAAAVEAFAPVQYNLTLPSTARYESSRSGVGKRPVSTLVYYYAEDRAAPFYPLLC